MADGDLLSLLLKVEGGQASAAEIEQLRNALAGVETQSDDLKEKFQHGFQHVALKSFIADGARAIGIGGEIRPILGMMNTGFTALASSVGLAGTGIGLAAAGLTALVGLGALVYEHTKKHSEALDELSKKQRDSVKTTQELRDVMKEYRKEVGALTPAMAELEKATKDLDDVQLRHLSHTQGMMLADNIKKQAADREHIELLESKKLQMESTAATTQDVVVKRDASRAAFEYGQQIIALNEGLVEQRQAQLKLKQDIAAHRTDDVDVEARAKKAIELAKEQKKAQQEIEDIFNKSKGVQFSNTQLPKMNEEVKRFEANAKHVSDAFARDFTHAFAQSALHGRNFFDSMKEGASSFAEHLITKLIEIRIEAAITAAAMSFFGPLPTAAAAAGKGLQTPGAIQAGQSAGVVV